MITLVNAPIKTKSDHKAALLRIAELISAKPGSEAHDELDVLVDLTEAYERRHHPIPRTTGAELLRHLMDANGLKQSDLPEIGSQTVISLLLSGKRELNLRQVKALAERFQIDASAFL